MSVTDADVFILIEILRAEEIKSVPGQTVYLKCNIPNSLLPLDVTRYPVTWYHQGEVVQYSDHELLTADYGLVLVNINTDHAGQYKCVVGQQTLSKYNAVIDSGELRC